MSTILVIDDIASNRDVIVTLLGYYGHRVLEAEDGVSGLKVARDEIPDLIIADILMPTMDGYEFVRQLRQDRHISATPVVFHTAHYLEKASRDLAAACAVSLILPKPSDPAEILRVVDLALGIDGRTPGLDLPDDFNREHLRLLTDKLAQKSANLRTANLRLSAVIQLGQELALEQDTAVLIQGYCSGACRVIGAAFAGVWLSESPDRLEKEVFFSGIDGPPAVEVDKFWRNHSAIEMLVKERRAEVLIGDGVRADGAIADPVSYSSLLVVPIFSGLTSYGWLGLWNKLGGDHFSEQDVEVACTICTQLAVRYENTLLLRQIRETNVRLEVRVGERTSELAAANAELSRSNKELEQYAFLASHDLQEPLRMVTIYSQLLLSRYRGSFDEQGEICLAHLQTGSQRMRTLVDDLLHYSRIVADRPDEAPLFALDEVVELGKANCAASIAETQAVVVCAALARIRGKADQFLQVFQNLISNALRYRRPEVAPVIEISGQFKSDQYVVSVSDNGMGFEMEYATQIFGLFKRLHDATIPGTGIGLAICKRVVENHGGRIWVESLPGSGSTFFFSLPSTSVETGQTNDSTGTRT